MTYQKMRPYAGIVLAMIVMTSGLLAYFLFDYVRIDTSQIDDSYRGLIQVMGVIFTMIMTGLTYLILPIVLDVIFRIIQIKISYRVLFGLLVIVKAPSIVANLLLIVYVSIIKNMPGVSLLIATGTVVMVISQVMIAVLWDSIPKVVTRNWQKWVGQGTLFLVQVIQIIYGAMHPV